MGFICRRCHGITEKLYRVTSEDAGVMMLNMLVCSSCARLAKNLGLPTIRTNSEKRADKVKPEPV
jgi:hypothetical protein